MSGPRFKDLAVHVQSVLGTWWPEVNDFVSDRYLQDVFRLTADSARMLYERSQSHPDDFIAALTQVVVKDFRRRLYKGERIIAWQLHLETQDVTTLNVTLPGRESLLSVFGPVGIVGEVEYICGTVQKFSHEVALKPKMELVVEAKNPNEDGYKGLTDFSVATFRTDI